MGILLLCLLAGCGAAGETEVPPEQMEDEAFAPDRQLLMSEDALEYMNREENSNGFVFGGLEEDDAFFYEFTRTEEPDFSLRISEDGETAALRYRGKTVVLEDQTAPDGDPWHWYISAGYGGAASGYGMPFWVDMTDDGQPDLIYLRGGTGTGIHINTCIVFDMVTMTEIPIMEPWQEMAEFVTVEPLEWKNGQVRCLVTDGEGHADTVYCCAEEDIWRKYAYSPVKSEWTAIEIDEEAGILRLSMQFGMPDPNFGAFFYMGELATELAYDAEQGAIVRSSPITVTVYPGDKT